MWAPLFPGRRVEHVPIGHITNGVHVTSWLAPQMKRLYDRHLGSDWLARSSEPGFSEAIDEVDDGELWETHQTLKAQLITVARRRAVQQAERGEPAEILLRCARTEPGHPDNRVCSTFYAAERANLVLGPRGSGVARQPRANARAVYSRARRIPLTRPGKGVLQQRAADARSRFAGRSCSSRTTTSTSAVWCRAMCG
jgi:starch phosphorylase